MAASLASLRTQDNQQVTNADKTKLQPRRPGLVFPGRSSLFESEVLQDLGVVEDRPLILQLAGHDPQVLVEAAQKVPLAVFCIWFDVFGCFHNFRCLPSFHQDAQDQIPCAARLGWR